MNWLIGKNAQKIILTAMLGLFIFPFQAVKAANIDVEGVVKLVNQARVKENLEPLVVNEKLAKAAQDKADDMIAHDYFAHNSPQGITPWDWITRNKYSYKYAGENLAMGFIDVQDEQRAWMNSPDHRKNILNENYQEIGVAVESGLIDGVQTIIAVQEFGSRADFVAPPKKAVSNIPQTQAKEDVLGASQTAKPNLVKESTLSGVVNSVSAQFKTSISKAAEIDWNRSLGTGAMLAFWLTVMANALIVVYLILDSLYLLNKEREGHIAKFRALYTITPDEYQAFIKTFSIDSVKLKPIHLYQMKPRK
jgi:hypothetical protein